MAKILLKTKPVRGFAALAAFLLTFGLVFALASCDSNDESGSGGGGGGGTNVLPGTTWKCENTDDGTKVLFFDQQGNGVTRTDDDTIPKGTYSISGNIVTMKFQMPFTVEMTGTISDDWKTMDVVMTSSWLGQTTNTPEVFVKQ